MLLIIEIVLFSYPSMVSFWSSLDIHNIGHHLVLHAAALGKYFLQLRPAWTSEYNLWPNSFKVHVALGGDALVNVSASTHARTFASTAYQFAYAHARMMHACAYVQTATHISTCAHIHTRTHAYKYRQHVHAYGGPCVYHARKCMCSISHTYFGTRLHTCLHACLEVQATCVCIHAEV